MGNIRVRYAPSPTGIPHIGNIRTALYNFLFAKSQKGQFILRIEDTDRARFMPESIPKIEESLKVLGLDWDERYQQSQRLDIYLKNLEILKKKNAVYEDGGAWKFKVEKDKRIKWTDVVHGHVEFSSDVIEDFVIVKSDRFPTYHFASVVDDHQMQISHVIRGDEWISSTPKHLLLYESFDWGPPTFVHIPSILGESRQKLSKREGAKSVLEYIDEGYLPEALVNFLALLGWSPPPPTPPPRWPKDSSEVKIKEQELFTLDELVAEFSLNRLNKNSPIFNIEKLNWFNKKYLQKLTIEELTNKIRDATTFTPKRKIIQAVRDRLTTLADFDKYASIFFKKGNEKPPVVAKCQNAKEAIESISPWTEQSITKTLDRWIEKNKLQPADFKNTLRLSVFADNTPPIYQSLTVLIKEEVLKRIDDAIKKSK